MGILNVTPDSFSDGSRYLNPRAALARAHELVRMGADIIDIGGESTRPGALEVPVEEELSRVLPVIRALNGKLGRPISIDTRKAAVARAALAEGATIVNDVSAMEFDPAMAETVARARAAIILMHMRGTPATMMRFRRYHDVVDEVCRYLGARARAAAKAGIAGSRIVVDPGIGFAKTAHHNLQLLNALPRLRKLGYPVLVGVSRKSFVRKISGTAEVEVLFGTAAAVALAIAAGASIVRVHDPQPMRAVARMVSALSRSAD
ncbi:MAG TPA: dihydropteroate synthase [Candidatus Binataceae bacterium]|nr:dihydropteroate synthase [Candidatus Binataceae bacterium]